MHREMTPPSSFVEVAPVRSEFNESYKNLSKDELRQELFFKSHNRLHKDGRIYHKMTPEGMVVAMSISPEYSEFRSQIEDGIYPIVDALKAQGYYTISSCEGHPFGALFKVGFATKLCRDYFASQILELNLKCVEVIPHDTCANIAFDLSKDGSKVVGGNRVNYEGDESYLRKEEAKGFNLQFDTSFKEWFFLNVEILNWPDGFHPIKRFVANRELKNKDSILKSIEDCIKGMPHYTELFNKNYQPDISDDLAELFSEME